MPDVNKIREVQMTLRSRFHEKEFASTSAPITLCHGWVAQAAPGSPHCGSKKKGCSCHVPSGGVRNVPMKADEEGVEFEIGKYPWEVPSFYLDAFPPPRRRLIECLRSLKCPKWLKRIRRCCQSPAGPSQAKPWSSYGRI